MYKNIQSLGAIVAEFSFAMMFPTAKMFFGSSCLFTEMNNSNPTSETLVLYHLARIFPTP
jgi:hypothetical protein